MLVRLCRRSVLPFQEIGIDSLGVSTGRSPIGGGMALGRVDEFLIEHGRAIERSRYRGGSGEFA